jgi:hypothetical protein
MRLSRPVYEGLPLLYIAIGVAAAFLFYIDPVSLGGKIACVIGFVGLIAGLTVFLRRHDYRALSREYNGESIEL